jgi:hypothetical protein
VHLIDVLDVGLHSFEGARLGVDVTRSEGDRAWRAGWHQLHEAVILVDLDVLLDARANLVDVERLRAVNIGHRNGNLDHCWLRDCHDLGVLTSIPVCW